MLSALTWPELQTARALATSAGHAGSGPETPFDWPVSDLRENDAKQI